MKTNLEWAAGKNIRFNRAFTLVELLTVIAIIGILAAMLLAVLLKVKGSSYVTRAKTEEAGLVNAIQGYDSAYGHFPVTKDEQSAVGTNDFTTGLIGFGQGINGNGTGYSFDNNSNVVAILMDLQTFSDGTQTANYQHIYNSKQTKFLSAKMAGYNPTANDPNPPGGVDNTGVYRDPWGNPYIITMDLNYDGECNDLLYSLKSVSQNPPGSTSSAGFNGLSNPNLSAHANNFLYHGKVMVWSAGPDKKYDTNPANTGVNKDNVLSW